MWGGWDPQAVLRLLSDAQGLQLPLGSSQDREHWALRRAELLAGTGYIPIQSDVVEEGIDTCPQD